MNNRYIFRGKGNPKYNDGEWYYGYLEYDSSDYQIVDPEYGSCKRTIIPETVGQCTGLKDKNGKLIFEGDIVKDKDSGLFGKVIFATAADGFDGMTGFMVDDVDDGLQNYNGFWHLVEVIGNIHDNRELLEVER